MRVKPHMLNRRILSGFNLNHTIGLIGNTVCALMRFDQGHRCTFTHAHQKTRIDGACLLARYNEADIKRPVQSDALRDFDHKTALHEGRVQGQSGIIRLRDGAQSRDTLTVR